MASFTQPPLFPSLAPINRSKTLSFSAHPRFNYLSSFKSSKISSSDSESSVSQENSPESEPSDEKDPVKLAFAKAKAYRKNKTISITVPEPPREPYGKAPEINDDVMIAVEPTLETAKEYKTTNNRSDAVKNCGREFAKMDEKNEGGQKEIPSAIELAMERAKEYKKSKGFAGETETPIASGGAERSPGKKQSTKNYDTEELSSIDFTGLGFSDKRSHGDLPAGLVPQSDPFPEGYLPEVEILVGDMTGFNNDALPASEQIPVQKNGSNVYRPKVSTWGVFPRRSNISKTVTTPYLHVLSRSFTYYRLYT